MHQRIGLWCSFSVAICLTLILGCFTPQNSHRAEIVDYRPDNPSQMMFQVVDLPDLVHFFSLEGQIIQTKALITVSAQEVKRAGESSTSFAQLKAGMQNKMGAHPLALNVLFRDGAFRAQDFDSLMAMSAYYHLAQIFEFAKNEVRSDNKAITTPLILAIYGSRIPSKEQPLPLMWSDNALFDPQLDYITLFRVGGQKGLPISLNPGVLAHEFHHRIFFYKVWLSRKELYQVFFKMYGEQGQKLDRQRVLLDGLDEGLADLFAVSYSRNPSFLNPSFVGSTGQRINKQRDLYGPFAEQATYDNLANNTLPKEIEEMKLCGQPSFNFQNKEFLFYCLGTVVTKALFEASGSNVETVTKDLLPIVHQALGDVSQALKDAYGDFDLHIFLNSLAKIIDPSLKAEFCRQYELRFESLYKQKGGEKACS